jgi:hypothetical protein
VIGKRGKQTSRYAFVLSDNCDSVTSRVLLFAGNSITMESASECIC